MEQKASDIQKQRIKEIELKADELVKSSICFQHEGDSLTLVGDVEIITDPTQMQRLWNEHDRSFFPKGIDDPKIRFIHFHTLEATFWIGHKFRTVKYKREGPTKN